MEEKKTGGPAFPIFTGHGYKLENASGLTARDYFATTVVLPHEDDVSMEWQEHLAGRKYPKGSDLDDRIQWEMDWRAEYRFRFADAMIKAGGKS